MCVTEYSQPQHDIIALQRVIYSENTKLCPNHVQDLTQYMSRHMHRQQHTDRLIRLASHMRCCARRLIGLRTATSSLDQRPVDWPRLRPANEDNTRCWRRCVYLFLWF